MAFVTVSKPHLRKLSQTGDRQALKILKLRSTPERVLSILQIGITLVGAVSAAVGGAGAEESLSPFFQRYFDISQDAAETLSIVAVVVPLTYLSVVIGELVPKTLALRFPMRFAKLGSYFLGALDRFFSPLVFLLEISTKFIISPFIKKMGAEVTTEHSSAIDIDDLHETNKQYVFNLIALDRRKVKDIIVPWHEVVKIEKTAHYREVLDLIRTTKYTRFPITEDGKPIGILHSKDFTSEVEVSTLSWNELIRPITFMNSEEHILNALKILQNKKSHMAAIRRQGELIGVVTLEDIFEEFVGDIYDEDDNPQFLLSSNSKIRTMNLSNK